ncbi:hypothetical protein K7X08_025414 [Anisodus acutangulus]|uniref:FAD-binding PCMH-type domain-containing protein n=1 Tax=Anisodus acutangulus TaxID=402998 RepID=A0A9Q1LSY5_9SOLA|nr:hypothetical protein K7X08_025414 [Anisodus acutangulus]
MDLKARFPDARLVVGNSEVGIEVRLKGIRCPVLISVAHVPELNHIRVEDDGLEIGAGVKLSQLVDVLKKGYREVDLTSSEILLSVSLPWNKPFEFVKEFKQSHRRGDDIAIVNAGMRVCL